MSDDPRVQQLLDELLDSHSTPEEVCGSCVELLPVVRERWRQMCRVRAELDAMFPPTPEPGVSPPAAPTGDTALPVIPGYEVEAVLGVGGMGVVFRARHLRLNRVVALKMALAGAYAGRHEKERFRRETEAVAGLKHPNVVQIYDVGDSDGRPFFTMEFVEGGTLAQKLTGTPLPARDAAQLLATLAGAVHAAHRSGIVHRDLKPANVLLATDATPKIGDFGLARRLSGETGLTHPGTALGTPSYMAPEQARGAGAAHPAVDVYALGAILYELLTGRPPFRAETRTETVHQLLTQDPVPPSRLNGKVPRDLDTICLKCLHKDPRRRYATAAALAEDLERFLRGDAIAARPERRLARLARRVRRRPALSAAIAATALLTVALVGGGAWALSEREAAARAARAEAAATERAADEDLREMAAALARSSWPEAKAALERAKGRLSNRHSAALRSRLDQGTRDLELVAGLDEIRLRLSRNSPVQLSPEALYAEAYRKYGIDLLTLEPAEAAARIRASAVRETVLAFLHDWLYWVSDANRARVRAAVDRADDDGWRHLYRDAIAAGDRDPGKMKALAAAPEAAAQHPVILSGVCGSLIIHGHRAEVLAVLNAAQQRHPGDFWINYLLGQFWAQDRPQLAVGYFRVTVAIRPTSDQAYIRLGRALRDTGDTDGAIDAFRRAIALNADGALVKDLAKLLAPRGGLDEVRVLWEKVLAADPPDYQSWYGYAQVCLFLGDEAAYRRAGKALLDRFRDTNDWTVAERTALACLLRPVSGEELQRAVALADRAAAIGPPAPQPDRGYVLFVKGLAEYRQGRMGPAIDDLGESAKTLTNRPGPRLVLAMAQFQSGSAKRARETLAAAVLDFNWDAPRADHTTAWVSHVLRREAERLILPNLPAFLAGRYQPQDHDERCALIGICQFTSRNRDLVRLYADIFAAAPRLADDLTAGHRYNAARAAALAGCARSPDAVGLDPPERARLRKRAREWIRADVALCRMVLDGDRINRRDEVREKLARLRETPDLAGVRDRAELENLSADERMDWLALWDEVDIEARRTGAVR